MKNITISYTMLALFIFMAFFRPIYAVPKPSHELDLTSSYRLDAGDKILIQVYHEPDLTLEAKLTDAGTVMFPFLGEISAKGFTIGQFKEKITHALEKLLVEPMVSIQVVAYRDFFVNGEVQKPGGYPYIPGMTVLKAVSVAGGFTDRASRYRAKLVQENAPNHKEISVGMNTPVSPGDVVIIEESFF